ncbi:hypothetical protein PG989_000911 [Apiospora arundinis]
MTVSAVLWSSPEGAGAGHPDPTDLDTAGRAKDQTTAKERETMTGLPAIDEDYITVMLLGWQCSGGL